MDCQIYFDRVNQRLIQLLDDLPHAMKEPMSYSVLNGGKRLRPILVYLIGEILNTPKEKLDIAACAVELVHCYSMVHDDLPAMDNDDLRRGKPTCHKKFDEATAILTGDSLLTLSFAILSNESLNPISAEQRSEMVKTLSYNSGAEGMVLGQVFDMQNIKNATEEQLILIHRNKTGALFRAAAQLGLIASGYIKTRLNEEIDSVIDKLGLAFQIQDDILEHKCTTEELGKSNTSDLNNEKTTAVSVMGYDKANEYLNALMIEVKRCISKLDNKWEKLLEFSKIVIRS